MMEPFAARSHSAGGNRHARYENQPQQRARRARENEERRGARSRQLVSSGNIGQSEKE